MSSHPGVGASSVYDESEGCRRSAECNLNYVNTNLTTESVVKIYLNRKADHAVLNWFIKASPLGR